MRVAGDGRKIETKKLRIMILQETILIPMETS